MAVRIRIKNGKIAAFEDEIPDFVLRDLKEIKSKRVSHIVPKNIILRQLFKILRSCCSRKSRIAEWTRHWPCLWMVEIDNSFYGPFEDRKKAIEYEKKILIEEKDLYSRVLSSLESKQTA